MKAQGAQAAHQVNDRITAEQVRLIDADGVNRGVVRVADAQAIAAAAGLDLVVVAEGSSPPVARVLDYGKFRYEQQKKAREAAKGSKATQVHQVKLRPAIADHDYDTKLATIRKFLQQGQRVKVTVTLKGRLVTHPELAARLLERLGRDLQSEATLSGAGALAGRDISVLITPL